MVKFTGNNVNLTELLNCPVLCCTMCYTEQLYCALLSRTVSFHQVLYCPVPFRTVLTYVFLYYLYYTVPYSSPPYSSLLYTFTPRFHSTYVHYSTQLYAKIYKPKSPHAPHVTGHKNLVTRVCLEKLQFCLIVGRLQMLSLTSKQPVKIIHCL